MTNDVPEVTIYRTDTWLPNNAEGIAGLDPWDPDTDDDGLTDGQEMRGLTRIISEQQHPDPVPMEANLDQSVDTSPNRADSDGDGWWDGWIAVYDVGRSDNVILYQEHLHTGDGIEEHERVDAMAGVHNETEAPVAGNADIDNDGVDDHANLHLGELWWGSDPNDRSEIPDISKTHLTVEVDYLEGYDPRNRVTGNGLTVLQNVEQNFQLYGITVSFEVDDRVTTDELQGREVTAFEINPADDDFNTHYEIGELTPDSFNRAEIIEVREAAHDDHDRLHLFWGNRIRNDDPNTEIDEGVDYDDIDPGGVAWNNGAPGTDTLGYIEDEFGMMIAADKYSNTSVGSAELQGTVMHELGHALSIGYADDTSLPIQGGSLVPRGYEVYSGNEDPDLSGGVDHTPERVNLTSGITAEWNIMSSGSGTDLRTERNISSNQAVYAFSIEEIITMDQDKVPSVDD